MKACCRISGVLMRFLPSTCLRSARSVTEMHTEHVNGAFCDIYFFFPFISTFFFYFPRENVAADVLLRVDSLFYRPSFHLCPRKNRRNLPFSLCAKNVTETKVTDK